MDPTDIAARAELIEEHMNATVSECQDSFGDSKTCVLGGIDAWSDGVKFETYLERFGEETARVMMTDLLLSKIHTEPRLYASLSEHAESEHTKTKADGIDLDGRMPGIGGALVGVRLRDPADSDEDVEDAFAGLADGLGVETVTLDASTDPDVVRALERALGDAIDASTPAGMDVYDDAVGEEDE